MPRVRLHPGLDLHLNAGVLGQQRRVAVGRAAGNDLDVPGVLQRFECAGNVPPVNLLKVRQSLAVPVFPVPGEIRQVVIALLPELCAVRRRRLDFAAQIPRKLVLKARVGKLLDQHGGQAEGNFGRDTFGNQLMTHGQQGQVGFSGGFRQPVGAVGRAPVGEDIGDVRVQHQRKRAERGGDTRGRHNRRLTIQFDARSVYQCRIACLPGACQTPPVAGRHGNKVK